MRRSCRSSSIPRSSDRTRTSPSTPGRRRRTSRRSRRPAARVLSRGLFTARSAWSRGERHPERLRARVEEVVETEPGVAPEYVSVADPLTLVELKLPANRAVISLAARVGKTRLIDNVLLGMEVSDLK